MNNKSAWYQEKEVITTIVGTGNDLRWEMISDYYNKCVECNENECEGHTHLYKIGRTKLYHDTNNNTFIGEYLPKSWYVGRKKKIYVMFRKPVYTIFRTEESRKSKIKL